ncbi:Tar ligand binding domain homologue [Ralstonia mannitolilytica]|uniref:Tar ligand binding domain homologue n=1 Tax=Ralstonia mannitolilytica TaxID=105219 RepID=A0AAJ4ZQP4_9RALS|nr:Tar ligand binding domain-containing protein [Ralstonia mannitolilytica]CAG2131571.1 hypothetical protein LMG6866_00745 [Ralstonia mannitolilytica]SUE26313.1 Tar ligand binding domain homologue [Ralstonia mannitolilytica]SUE36123.1 Tar ligand binding domain homologue [Ralstonia mannitolilytica]
MKTLSIKARLALVLFVLAVFLAGVGALGLYGNLRSNAALKETYANQLASTRALGQAVSRLVQARTALDRAVYESDDAKIADLVKAARAQIAASDEGWKAYNALPFATPEEEQTATEAKRLRDTFFREGMEPVLAAFDRHDYAAARPLVLDKLYELFVRMR